MGVQSGEKGQGIRVENPRRSYAVVRMWASICRHVVRAGFTVSPAECPSAERGSCAYSCCCARHGAGGDQQGLTELRDRAETAYSEGRLLDALSDYERLVSLFPEEGCLHGRLAGCAAGTRAPDFSRRHLRIAIKLGCGDVDLEFHRARMAQLEYDFDRARDLYAAYVAAAGKKVVPGGGAEGGRCVALPSGIRPRPLA